jgi:hypothetical protein
MDFNWKLIAELFNFLSCMEETEKWDLSTGESSLLVESLYTSIMRDTPVCRDNLEGDLMDAYAACWGKDNEEDIPNAYVILHLAYAVIDGVGTELKMLPEYGKWVERLTY